MYPLANQENPPKCARPSCDNTTSKYTKPKNGNIWKKYCCSNCQVPSLKGTSKYSYPELAPECLNADCKNLTQRRTRKYTGWNKFCSSSCASIFKGPPILSTITKTKISDTVSNIWTNRSDQEKDQIFSKSKKKRFTSKSYVFPSGKTVYVHGNEDKAIDNLLSEYKESEIIAGSDLSLAISYIKSNGKNGRYYPEIFIPTYNLIIEVKSQWTYNGRPEWLESNLLKQKACLDAGYNFKFMIL